MFAEIHYSDNPERSALFYSIGANKYHGLPRSNADKKRCVSLVLGDAEWQKMSDRAIAEHCGVSAPFVGRVRSDLENEGTIAPVNERTSKSGKVLDTTKIGKKTEPELELELGTSEALPILEYLESSSGGDRLGDGTPWEEEPKPVAITVAAVPSVGGAPGVDEDDLDWQVLIDSVEAMASENLISLAKVVIDRCLRYKYVSSLEALLPPGVEPDPVYLEPSPVDSCGDCGDILAVAIVWGNKLLCSHCYTDRKYT
jgi:hypothetical protein